MTFPSAKDPVQLTLQDQVATLTINRPQAQNALTPRMVDTLLLMLKALEADSEIKVLIVEGAGDSFCAGEDFGEVGASGDPIRIRQFREATVRLMRAIQSYQKIVITKIRGAAHGPGLDLVLGSDFALAAPDATFSASLLKDGAAPWTSMVALSRSLSSKHAIRMLLSPAPASANEALSMGIISEIVPSSELDAGASRLAEQLVAAAPGDLQFAVQAFRRQLGMPVDEAYAFAVEASLKSSPEEERLQFAGREIHA
ncbi:enoyl-CoA hydratase/isomerase family protein [Rhodoligotrophos defluvii]|uniref:enoyl-CoA hydratase/isomerase family protein n=1 Tax=Rhodoligotrophos defluvii TaxID=2561934 RepID=UPI001485B8ED|nr:enoyl-CoA hydratase/isomerase family protein [Rhodoligotrophos defluvii]